MKLRRKMRQVEYSVPEQKDMGAVVVGPENGHDRSVSETWSRAIVKD